MTLRPGLTRLWIVLAATWVIAIGAVTLQAAERAHARDLAKSDDCAAKAAADAASAASAPAAGVRPTTHDPIDWSCPPPDRPGPMWVPDTVTPTVENGAAIALVPPLVVLAFGSAMAWAVAGFRR